jgi:hypothetical protein
MSESAASQLSLARHLLASTPSEAHEACLLVRGDGSRARPFGFTLAT